MLKWDLLFNGIITVLDLLFVFSFLRVSKSIKLLLFRFVLFGFSAFVISILVTAISHLRFFATMRFLGMVIFWHVPLILLIAGVLSNKKSLFSAVSCLLVGIYLYAYYVEPRQLQITRYTYRDARLSSLKRHILLAQVSD